MRLDELVSLIKEKHCNGEKYETIGKELGITKTNVWQIEHGYKPGKKLSAILKLDPEPTLQYTRTRREHLDEIARNYGHKSWSSYETFVLHHDRIMP